MKISTYAGRSFIGTEKRLDAGAWREGTDGQILTLWVHAFGAAFMVSFARRS